MISSQKDWQGGRDGNRSDVTVHGVDGIHWLRKKNLAMKNLAMNSNQLCNSSGGYLNCYTVVMGIL